MRWRTGNGRIGNRIRPRRIDRRNTRGLRIGFRPDGGTGKKLAVAWLFRQAGGWNDRKFHCSECKLKGLYKERNCEKFYPELVDIKRRPSWSAHFRIRTKEKVKQFSVAGYRLSGCPVSLIAPETLEMLAFVEGDTGAGSCLFGPDASLHPAWFYDALRVVSHVRSQYEIAEVQAV